MPKYKLRMPGPGDYIYCDGDAVYVGETADDALTFYIGEEYAYDVDEVWVCPEILRGRCVYARDIEAGDCHEDAEPGDTTFDLVVSGDAALRPLKAGEILTWPRGSWRPFWTYGPTRTETAWGPGFMAQVGTDVLGEDFPTREAAQEAVECEAAKRIEAWKRDHPQFCRAVPSEADDA